MNHDFSYFPSNFLPSGGERQVWIRHLLANTWPAFPNFFAVFCYVRTKVPDLIESSEGKDGQNEDDVDEDSPGKPFDLARIDCLVKCKLVREASENPAEWSHNHIGSSQGTRKHYDLIAVFEGQKPARNREEDLKHHKGPYWVEVEYFAEKGVDECSHQKAEDFIK